MESTTSDEICKLRRVTDELLQENERLRGLLSSTSYVRRCGECSREIDRAEVPRENIPVDPDPVGDGVVLPATPWISPGRISFLDRR